MLAGFFIFTFIYLWGLQLYSLDCKRNSTGESSTNPAVFLVKFQFAHCNKDLNYTVSLGSFKISE